MLHCEPYGMPTEPEAFPTDKIVGRCGSWTGDAVGCVKSHRALRCKRRSTWWGSKPALRNENRNVTSNVHLNGGMLTTRSFFNTIRNGSGSNRDCPHRLTPQICIVSRGLFINFSKISINDFTMVTRTLRNRSIASSHRYVILINES